MALPTPLETVTVRGTWLSPATGAAISGVATLRAVNVVRSPAGDVLLTRSPARRILVNGAAEWTGVLATDSVGLSAEVAYELEVFGSGHHERGFYELRKASAVAGVINLADIAVSEEPPELVVYVLASSVGQVGGPAGPLDEDGLVPADQLPAGGGGGAVASVDGRTGVVTLGDLYIDPSELATGLAGKANTSHTHTASQVTDLTAAVDARVQLIVDAAPAALDTLNELAAALNDDPAFAATVTTALATKAPINNPTFTGTVAGVSKTMVGLGNVDNTSDASKPVSTATQTALNLKAPLASPAFTGTPTGITKTHVGLGNVDNTSDLSKPISTATQAALDGKAPLNHDHTFETLLHAMGLCGITAHPLHFGGGASPAGNDHLIVLVPVEPGAEIPGFKVAVQTAGTYSATGTPAQVRAYDFDGALLGTTPDDPTLWLAGGIHTCLLPASFDAPVNGLIYVGVSFGGFSGAAPAIANGNQTAAISAGLLAGGRRMVMYGNSGAGLPASIDPTSYGLATSWAPLVGVMKA